MKDASSTTGDYNPNYEERRKKFDPAHPRSLNTNAQPAHRRGNQDAHSSDAPQTPVSAAQPEELDDNTKSDKANN